VTPALADFQHAVAEIDIFEGPGGDSYYSRFVSGARSGKAVGAESSYGKYLLGQVVSQ